MLCVVLTEQYVTRGNQKHNCIPELSMWSIWCPTGGSIDQIQLIFYGGLEKSSQAVLSTWNIKQIFQVTACGHS